MKALRVVYIVITPLLLFAGLITGRREIFILLAAALLFLLSALCLNVWTFVSVRFSQTLPSLKAVKGEAPVMKIHIANEMPFPFPMMTVHVETILASEKRVFQLSLAPKSEAAFEIPVNCAYRGVYKVGMTMLEVNDMFGFLHLKFDLCHLPYYRMKELKIYPRLVSLPYLPAHERDSKYKSSRSAAAEQGDTFSSLRAYRPGDAGKKIHWPSFARRRELLVRNYDAPTETAVMLLLDNSYTGFAGEELLRYADLACECAAAIIHCSLRAGYGTVLTDASPEGELLRQADAGNFQALLETLAVMPFPVKGDPLQNLRQAVRFERQIKTVYYMTGRQPKGFADRLMEQVYAGCQVKLLLLGSEKREEPENTHQALLQLPVSFGEDVASVLGGIL